MKHAKLADMVKGWFVGDFAPVVLRSADVEVAVKHYEWIRRGLVAAGMEPSTYNIALAWNSGLQAATSRRAPASSGSGWSSSFPASSFARSSNSPIRVCRWRPERRIEPRKPCNFSGIVPCVVPNPGGRAVPNVEVTDGNGNVALSITPAVARMSDFQQLVLR